jgi:hypothetical protein
VEKIEAAEAFEVEVAAAVAVEAEEEVEVVEVSVILNVNFKQIVFTSVNYLLKCKKVM